MNYRNTIIGLILLVIVFFLIRDVLRNKVGEDYSKAIDNIQLLGAALLLLMLAIGLFLTKEDVW